MATLADPQPDFATLPDMAADVFTAPLARPAHVGEDWLEPAQTAYTADDHKVWDDLFARQMDVLPGRACSAFMAGLEKLEEAAGALLRVGKMWRILDTELLGSMFAGDALEHVGQVFAIFMGNSKRAEDPKLTEQREVLLRMMKGVEDVFATCKELFNLGK